MNPNNLFQQAAAQQPAPAPAGSLIVPAGFMEGLAINLFHNRSFWIGLGSGLLAALVAVMMYGMFVRTPAATEAEMHARIASQYASKAELETAKAKALTESALREAAEKQLKDAREELKELRAKK